VTLRRNPPPREDEPRIYERDLGRLRLFLDDLDDLVALLRSRCADVTISAGYAEADEPEDLRGATRRELRRINIVTSEPSIAVYLGSRAGSVSTYTPTAEAKSLIDDVYGLLIQRRAKTAGLKDAGPILAIGAIIPSLIAYSTVSSHNRTTSATVVGLGIAVGIFAFLLLVSIGVLRDTNVASVVLERRRDRRGLSREVRVRLVWFLAGAVVSLLAAGIQAWATWRAK
jgi:hypothetical protein